MKIPNIICVVVISCDDESVYRSVSVVRFVRYVLPWIIATSVSYLTLLIRYFNDESEFCPG